jgi:hydroxypyruvate isomerase
MKFSVCIESLYRGLDGLAALDQVKACGYTAFEFWGWQNRDLEALSKKAAGLGLSCAGFCTKNFFLNDPPKRVEFLEGLKESVAAAKKMGAKFLITQSGEDTGARRDFQHKAIIEGLKEANAILKGSGVTLLLEPLNRKVDHKGTYLESSDEGFEIIDEAGSEHVKLLFDMYHQQISEGDVIRRACANINKIAHIHAAGNPGRNELDRGELDYNRVFKALESAGYKGYAGLEYFPVEDPAAGLKKFLAGYT